MNYRPCSGQRWLSEMEPELGLGVVVEADGRRVTLEFPAADAVRTYALASAPLERVAFAAGDLVHDRQGRPLLVEEVREEDGRLFYCGSGRVLDERELADTLSGKGPEQRLAAGDVDKSAMFDLRVQTLVRRYQARKSPVRGFLGGRLDLIPHQFFIAEEVAGRYAPRVLLADEVGLGKTIEACLIIHRLLLSGRASRVLILTPPSLVHQWLVELLRRFQLRFSIFDRERYQALERSDPHSNPFGTEQLVLAGAPLLADDERIAAQAAEAEWDLLVIDEAHHLRWSPDKPSREYLAVEQLAARTPGLLLLTATPEQLGEQSHFARLRLLDPDRYPDFESFLAEGPPYRDVARQAAELLARMEKQSGAARRKLESELADLIDRHGTGRVMFRNTRAAVGGFPRRVVHFQALKDGERPSASFTAGERIAKLDAGGAVDPARIDYLVALLKENRESKFLLICRSKATVLAIDAALRARLKVASAMFHEDLSIVQRDRNAAWFADPSGARILLCSEIGSEGRNFQFAQHLILFDLPADPDLLEQRIGRLDRIGQKGDVHIHVPYAVGGAEEMLLRWYHEGLGAFERSCSLGAILLERFGARLHDLMDAAARVAPGTPAAPASGSNAGTASDVAAGLAPGTPAAPAVDVAAAFEQLLVETARAAKELEAEVEAGRDRLLELSSFRRDKAQQIIQRIREHDADEAFEEFFLRLLESYRVYAEEVAPSSFLLNPERMQCDELPMLEGGDRVITFDRSKALEREDFELFSSDHPLFEAATETLLGSERGSAAFAVAAGQGGPRLELEALFVLECVAPTRLHMDRFLPPVPLRVLVDQHGREVGPPATATAELVGSGSKRPHSGGGLDEDGSYDGGPRGGGLDEDGPHDGGSHDGGPRGGGLDEDGPQSGGLHSGGLRGSSKAGGVTAMDGGDDLRDGDAGWLAGHRGDLAPLISRMVEGAHAAAAARVEALTDAADEEIAAVAGSELRRLEQLAAVNPNIRSDEIESARRHLGELRGYLSVARLRLDSLRLIVHGKLG